MDANMQNECKYAIGEPVEDKAMRRPDGKGGYYLQVGRVIDIYKTHNSFVIKVEFVFAQKTIEYSENSPDLISFYLLESESRENLDKKSGFVYCINAVGTNRFKIGFTKNPSSRLQQLARQSPYPLKLIYLMYTFSCRFVEARLHEELWKLNKHGEWFELSDQNRQRAEKLFIIEPNVQERNITYHAFILLCTRYKLYENNLLKAAVNNYFFKKCIFSQRYNCQEETGLDIYRKISQISKRGTQNYYEFWESFKEQGEIGKYIRKLNLSCIERIQATTNYINELSESL